MAVQPTAIVAFSDIGNQWLDTVWVETLTLNQTDAYVMNRMRQLNIEKLVDLRSTEYMLMYMK